MFVWHLALSSPSIAFLLVFRKTQEMLDFPSKYLVLNALRLSSSFPSFRFRKGIPRLLGKPRVQPDADHGVFSPFLCPSPRLPVSSSLPAPLRGISIRLRQRSMGQSLLFQQLYQTLNRRHGMEIHVGRSCNILHTTTVAIVVFQLLLFALECRPIWMRIADQSLFPRLDIFEGMDSGFAVECIERVVSIRKA